MSDLIIRPGKGEDLPYIHDTWVREGRRPRTPVSGRRKFAHVVLSEQVRGIIELDASQVRVVCHEKTPELVLAWMITEPWSVEGRNFVILYFAHTSKSFRKLGLASALIEDARMKGGKDVVVLASGCKMWQKDLAVARTDWCFDYDFLPHRLLYERA